MILYETNIPHVYCVYEGVTINAINTNGNVLLEDNTLLDEDCFYTVIDVIDENAHARKAVVKGIKNAAEKVKGHNIFFRNGEDFVNKADKVLNDRQKRTIIRSYKKINHGKINYNKTKKILAHNIDKKAGGRLGFYDPKVNIIGIDKNKLKDNIKNMGIKRGSEIGKQTIRHELRHRDQYNHTKKLYGVQSTRNGIKVTKKFKHDAYNKNPLEYDAFKTTSKYNDSPKGKKLLTKKDRMNSLKEKYRDELGDIRDMDSNEERFERVTYALAHPKYAKKYSKHDFHDISNYVDFHNY